MIEIQVAGAGAGKTYGLARRVADSINGENSTKTVYAITYTNSAQNEIERQLNKILGYLPERVRVETVHSFLLNTVIYPFSPFVTGTIYSSTTTAPLAGKIKYRQKQKRELKDQAVLHAEDAYDAARRVVDREMSAHNTKAKRSKVDRVLTILSCAIDRIYMDEVQDLDKTALGIFETLGRSVADIYMVGDPKQAIKYSSAFLDFISKFDGIHDPVINVLPPVNDSRRVPKKILNISNRFCFKGQEQKSKSESEGALSYIESTNPEYKSFLESSIVSGNIVCIDKMCVGYATHDIRHTLPAPICDLVVDACGYFDPQIYLKAANLGFSRDLEDIGSKRAASKFFTKHGISYDKRIFALLIQVASKKDRNDEMLVRSIDSVKGLESDECVLVLTPNTYKYLIQESLQAKQYHNKEWNRIYVALTRAKRRFIVAIDHSLFESQKYGVDDVRDNLVKLGFTALQG